ncbi:hypothetical protein QCA50_014389 [Cerrena zonata]|uniref:SnoaL-like domain-containing protein n=1 Tax=Cerrena zonata TaxID=2478898 RepID=A0AAW0FSR6_9APHY
MSSPVVTGAIPTNLFPQVRTVVDYVTVICDSDWSKLESLLTDDFIWYIYPKSLGLPLSNKAEWIKFNADASDIFKRISSSISIKFLKAKMVFMFIFHQIR